MKLESEDVGQSEESQKPSVDNSLASRRVEVLSLICSPAVNSAYFIPRSCRTWGGILTCHPHPMSEFEVTSGFLRGRRPSEGYSIVSGYSIPSKRGILLENIENLSFTHWSITGKNNKFLRPLQVEYFCVTYQSKFVNICAEDHSAFWWGPA